MEIFVQRKIVHGGIFGKEYTDNVEIDRCYNKGNIKGKLRVAGLAGGIDCWHDDVVTIKNSYNTGKIIASSGKSAGIVCDDGRDANLFIKNTYNVGVFDSYGSNVNSYAISGKGELTNVFFLDICNSKYSDRGIAISKAKMKEMTFVVLLNGDAEDEIWIKDNKNINEGYPILKWQL